MSIITFCFWCGMLCLCTILIIYSVLNWLKPPKTKSTRLNIMAGIAFVALCILVLPDLKEIYPEVNDDFLFHIVKFVIGGLLLGCITFSVIALLILIIRCIFTGVYHILNMNAEMENTCPKSSESVLADVCNGAGVKIVIVAGIISLFLIIPFLMGAAPGKKPMESWEAGAKQIGNYFSIANNKAAQNNEEGNSNNSPDALSKCLITYTLIYIILLGLFVAVAKILYSIIEQTLNKTKNRNLIDEYSSPIALLAVGVALLMLLQNGDIPKESRFDTVIELLKSFATVIFIAAITILTLEIIRLLMDIRNNFIRKEARYIFISLIGQASLLLLGILNMFSNAINSAIGITIDIQLYRMDKKLRQKVIDVMEETIDSIETSTNNSQEDDENRDETTFSPFEEKVTKK